MGRSADNPSTSRGRGRAVLNGLLAAALVVMLAGIGWLGAEAARVETSRRMVENEALRLYAGLCNYYDHHGEFPNSYAEPLFEPATIEPLRSRGYYEGQLTSALIKGRVDGYESPDDRGLNQEFWLELTLDADPSRRYLIARSDDSPVAGGRWLDGVFALREGKLEPLP